MAQRLGLGQSGKADRRGAFEIAETRRERSWLVEIDAGHLGTADLAREPLPPLELLKARQQVSGWVAISDLARTRKAGDYAWLDGYRPVERIGKTIDLYYIP
jgi:hypothetical protein